MKSMRFNEGKCPNCKSEVLVYSQEEYYQDSLTYPFECANCNLIGREWYDIEYAETTIDVGGRYEQTKSTSCG